MELMIEIKKTDLDILNDLKATSPDSVKFVKVRHFGGGTELTAAIVTLSTATITIIGKIIIEMIRAKKYIKVKVKGIEISGLSEANALSILEKYINKDLTS